MIPLPLHRVTATPDDFLLLPYQRRWFADQADVKVCEKSRRTGFTWTSACRAVLTAAEGTMDAWYIGYNIDQAQEFIRDCAWWAEKLQLAASETTELLIADPKNDIQALRIVLASGKRITALSSRPRNLRGKQGLIVLDEAAFHDQLGELIKAAMALLMWGGQVEIISTHDGEDNEFAKLVDGIREGRHPYSLHRVTLDDALAEGLYKRICLVTKRRWSSKAQETWRAELIEAYGEGAAEELFCQPSGAGRSYINRHLVEACMVPGTVARLELEDDFALRPEGERERHVETWVESELNPLLAKLDADRPHYFGQDFGRTSDITVIAPMALQADLTRAVPFLVELRRVPFEQQRQVLFHLVDRLPRMAAGKLDAGGNGQYLAEVAQQRWGARRIEQVHLSNAWYAEHLPPFKAGFEESLIQLPRDLDVLTDLTALRKIDGLPKLPKAKTNHKKGQSRHGDAAIALALAYTAARTDDLDRYMQAVSNL